MAYRSEKHFFEHITKDKVSRNPRAFDGSFENKPLRLKCPFQYTTKHYSKYVKVHYAVDRFKKTSLKKEGVRNDGSKYTYWVRGPDKKYTIILYKWIAVSVPYYIYKYIYRTAGEWMLIIKSLEAIINEGTKFDPTVQKVISKSHAILQKNKEKILAAAAQHFAKRCASDQNPVIHGKTRIQRTIISPSSSSSGGEKPLNSDSLNGVRGRIVSHGIEHDEKFHEEDKTYFNENIFHRTTEETHYTGYINSICRVDGSNKIRDTKNANHMLMTLWPGSGEFQPRATPSIDIAEAASGGFPLGEVPNPQKTFSHMKNAARMPIHNRNKIISTIKKSGKIAAHGLDLAANTLLWAQLVIEPLVRSALALSVSIKANDLVTDELLQRSKDDGWHQGKGFQFCDTISDGIESFDFDRNYNYLGSEFSTRCVTQVEQNEIHANISYKLDYQRIQNLNRPHMRIAHHMQRLSNSLQTVAYNLIPLSFVYGWFDDKISRHLRLKDKVFIPLSDFRLSVSYKNVTNMKAEYRESSRDVTYIKQRWMAVYNGEILSASEVRALYYGEYEIPEDPNNDPHCQPSQYFYWTGSNTWMYGGLQFEEVVDGPAEPTMVNYFKYSGNKPDSGYYPVFESGYAMVFEITIESAAERSKYLEVLEQHSYYDRVVYTPSQINVSHKDALDHPIDCNTGKSNLTTGKYITGAALAWSFLRGRTK